MALNPDRKVFVVVEVQSGVAVNAKCFRSLDEAQSNYDAVAESLNLQEDDVQIFESDVT